MPGAIGAISNAAAACDVLQTNLQQQAQPGQVIEVSNHALPGPSSGRKAVMYAPFVSMDVIKQSLGKNLVRDLNDKSLMPLVAQDDVAQAQLQHLKQEYQGYLLAKAMPTLNKIEELRSIYGVSEEECRNRIGNANFDDAMRVSKHLIRLSELLSNMEVRSNEDGRALFDLTPEMSKLYIVGHGGAGSDILTADSAGAQGIVSVAELAEQLAAGGLNRDFRDFRVTACYSADARKPTSFQQEELRNAAQGKRPGFLGLFSRPMVLRRPFSQYLSNALSERGFSHPEVSGYHGAGVTFSKIGHHARRVLNSGLPDVRASEVRQVFTPTNK